MEKKITLDNILSYIEGSGQKLMELFKLQPQHIREQIAYRRLLCKDDCAVTNKCVYCGCDFLGKTSVRESCNKGQRFPDLMNNPAWQQYKKDNGIE